MIAYKPTSLALCLLLVGGLSLPLDNARADTVTVIGKSSRHHAHQGKIITIKRPTKRHNTPHHREHVVVVPRKRHFRGVRVQRPHGRPYFGYSFFYSDDEAFKWLAFTAIPLKVLDNLNEDQQRLHEAAQVRATTADVDEIIVWEDGGASGSVKTARIGKSTSGRHCREFQQSVTIGGKTEQAYGVACLQPDGAWEIVQ